MPAELSFQKLMPYLPGSSVDIIGKWLASYKQIEFALSRKRRTKLGDYRPPQSGRGHRITVNQDLNPFLFTLTLTHEICHFEVWKQYKGKVRPHGNEWKQTYWRLLSNLINKNVFPDEATQLLLMHGQNPPASCSLDIALMRSLRKFDPVPSSFSYLEDLPEGSIFKIEGGRVFSKGKKLRKRYRCQEIDTKRAYLFSLAAQVEKC